MLISVSIISIFIKKISKRRPNRKCTLVQMRIDGGTSDLPGGVQGSVHPALTG